MEPDAMARDKGKAGEAWEYAVQVTEERPGSLLLALKGRLSLEHSQALNQELQQVWTRGRVDQVLVNLKWVEYLDSAGALILLNLSNQARERGVVFKLAEVPPRVQEILDLMDPEALTRPTLRPAPQAPGLWAQMTQGVMNVARDLVELLIFVGDLVFALGRAALHPHRVRWEEVLVTMKRAGLDGVPILGLMSLLLGMVIAFMSALQLQQLGATIYVASLVGIAMVKELGPILTAILVAGRSGSAFAAEIGTMKVNEEVDALLVMGFDPMGFLAVPKVLAAAVVVPVLTVYATFAGILGGLFIGVTLLDLTAYTFVNEVRGVMKLFDISTSLIKAVVFGVVVAGIGCQRGFTVTGGAEGVGLKTTSAVVASLFLIIIIDAAFAIVLHYIR
jgi:phospholipid/cholesterol/gamma-HCH transport system permease protein